MKIVVDDWGLNPEINKATIELAAAGHLYGVSLFANAPYTATHLETLLSYRNIRLGLHFNLTTTWSSAEPSFAIRNISKHLYRKRALSTLEAQYNTLLSVTKRVDYIDGHHHAHLLPGIYTQVKKFANHKQIPLRFIRDTAHWPSYVLCKVAEAQPPEHIFYCRYLVANDFSDSKKLKEKLNNSTWPCVAHPALKADDQISPVYTVHDSIAPLRVKQHTALMELR